MQKLQDRVAVVTGAASGLGRAMAITLAREGMQVVAADIRKEAAEHVACEIRGEGGRAIASEVDVARRASVQALADRVDTELGAVHLLCNNAGVVAKTPLREPEEENWRWIVDVNLFGVVYGVQTFLPAMLERGDDGHIVNTASISGLIAPGEPGRTAGNAPSDPGISAKVAIGYGYTATKYAVVGLSEALHAELVESSIGVSVLCPNAHRTDIFDNSARGRPERFGGATRSPGTIAEQIARGSVHADRLKDPFEAARRVVEGVRQRQLYIITHPDDWRRLEGRFQHLRSGFEAAAAFSA